MVDPEIALIEALYAQADAAAANERSRINRFYAQEDLELSKRLQSTQAWRSINSKHLSQKKLSRRRLLMVPPNSVSLPSACPLDNAH